MMSELKLELIPSLQKPKSSAFYCPHCYDTVSTIDNCVDAIIDVPFPGIIEVTWLGIRCDFCNAAFDLHRTTHQREGEFYYTGSLTLYARPQVNEDGELEG